LEREFQTTVVKDKKMFFSFILNFDVEFVVDIMKYTQYLKRNDAAFLALVSVFSAKDVTYT
jgi:hypothetical protein